MPRRVCLLGVTLAAAALAGSAFSGSSLEGSFVPGSGSAFVPVHGSGSCIVTAPTRVRGCLSVGSFRAEDAVLSPDERSLYTIGSFGHLNAAASVRVFSRDVRTGLLTPLAGRHGCARTWTTAGKCGPIFLSTPTAITVSPDGRELYITGLRNGGFFGAYSFLAIQRDPRTGALGRAIGQDPRAVPEGDDVAVSPDGRSVYVASASGTYHGLAILRRNPRSGALTQLDGAAGCIQRIGADGCATAPVTSFAPGRVLVSPDGESVYVLSNEDLFTFARDIATGALADGTCFMETPVPPCAPWPVQWGPDGGPGDVVASPDGRNVYLFGVYGDSATTGVGVIVTFARKGATSLIPLTGSQGCIAGSAIAAATCQVVPALTSAGSGFDVISANDRSLVTGVSPNQERLDIVTFRRDPADNGALQPSGQVVRIRVRALYNTVDTIIQTRDGRDLYLAGTANGRGDVIVAYRRH